MADIGVCVEYQDWELVHWGTPCQGSLGHEQTDSVYLIHFKNDKIYIDVKLERVRSMCWSTEDRYSN